MSSSLLNYISIYAHNIRIDYFHYKLSLFKLRRKCVTLCKVVKGLSFDVRAGFEAADWYVLKYVIIVGTSRMKSNENKRLPFTRINGQKKFNIL